MNRLACVRVVVSVSAIGIGGCGSSKTMRWSIGLLLLLAVGACGSTANPGSDGGGGSNTGGAGGTTGGGGRGGGGGAAGSAGGQSGGGGAAAGTSGGGSGSGGATGRGGQSGTAGAGQGGRGGTTGNGGTGGQGATCQTNANCPSGQVCYRGVATSCGGVIPGTCVTRESTNCGQTTGAGCPCLALPSSTTCSSQGAYCSGSDEAGQCWICKLPQ